LHACDSGRSGDPRALGASPTVRPDPAGTVRGHEQGSRRGQAWLLQEGSHNAWVVGIITKLVRQNGSLVITEETLDAIHRTEDRKLAEIDEVEVQRYAERGIVYVPGLGSVEPFRE